MERYRESDETPGLSDDVLSNLRSQLEIFYHRPFDLTGLKTGVSFGDDPIVLEDKTRGFIARCEICHRPALMEIYNCYNRDRAVDWLGLGSGDIYKNEIPENYANRVLISEHASSSCKWNYAKSSRTGEKVLIHSL